MSRSRKKQPFAAIAADSDKPFKQRTSRRMRRVSKARLAATQDGDALPVVRELGDTWNSDKESKPRVADPKDKRLRK
jgi:hypothetical protein